MWFLIVLFACSGQILTYSAEEEGPVVVTRLGPVKGTLLTSRGNRKIASFTAIPFALPPVGDLRFKAPVPVTESWTEVFDATKETPKCIQRNPYIRQEEIVGQEDCLYLNVYTPFDKLENTKPLPVMVWIHGGGLMCGDSSTHMYGPHFLLDRDVVLVTINYRLGPLGFLSTKDEHCPGNNGLKDQQEALRWVQKHIHSFGGDNASVTIFGESAGGASVHFHMISETSQGLFHRGISESGTALVPWAAPMRGEALQQALLLAKFLDCPQAPSAKMIACLRTRDAYDIINTEFRFYKWDYDPMTPFKAVIEPDLPGAFLTKDPSEAIANTKVPWLTGVNSGEGCLKSVWITNNESRLEEFVAGFPAIAPVTFYYENSPHLDTITQKIRNAYNLDSNDIEAFKVGLLEAYSDSYFDYPMVEAVELTLQKTKGPVYLYYLAYRANNSFSQIFGDSEGGDYGVCHADELMHLFPIDFLDRIFSTDDISISNFILDLWTNFATSGNPNEPIEIPVKWDPVSDWQNLDYYEISLTPKMGQKLSERSRLWGSLPLWHHATSRRIIDEL